MTDTQHNVAILEATERIANIGGWELDVKTGKTIWTRQTYKIHEVEPGFEGNYRTNVSFYHEDFEPMVRKAVERTIKDAEPFDIIAKLITAKGNERWVRAFGEPVLEDGRVIKLQGVVQDVTKVKQIQDKLEQANREKSIALGTIHERVKENLQVVVGLLAMQHQLVDDTEYKVMLESHRWRINAMSKVHEMMYEQGSLDRLNFAAYIREMVPLTIAVSGKTNVQLTMHLQDIELVLNDALACAMIINELVDNALKHGFNGGSPEPELQILFGIDGDKVSLIVQHNGLSVPEQLIEQDTLSLGFTIIDDFVWRLPKGKWTISPTGVVGTIAQVMFEG
jgi:two-component sensor histidine kinase